MNLKRTELAQRVYQITRLEGEFRLRSGAVASEYFDKYRFESDPALLRAISKELISLVPTGIQALAGLELGGIPVATVMSQLSNIPTVFVRKAAKDYGTEGFVEGMDIAGRRLCMVEDVVTSGGQLLESTRALRSSDAIVDTAVCVIDREQGATEALKEQGIELRVLFTRSDLERQGGPEPAA